MNNNKIRLEFPSQPENVALARLIVASIASQMNFTLSDIEELKVVVSEAVSNSIIHAYEGRPSGLIQLEAVQEENTLILSITDSGKGIADIRRALEPAYSTDPERMGLGFVFMQSFMDDLQVKSKPGKGTTVILSKKTDTRTSQLKSSCN